MAPPTLRDLDRAKQRLQQATDAADQARSDLGLLVVRLANSEIPKKDIADRLGVHKTRVSQILAAHKEASAELATPGGATPSEATDEVSKS